MQQRTGEPIVDVPVQPAVHTAEQFVDVTVSQTREAIVLVLHVSPAIETAEVFQLVPPDRPTGRTVEKSSDVPGPQNQESIVGEVEGVPKERLAQRTGEHAVDGPAPQNQERLAGVAGAFARASVQMVEAPVPLIRTEVAGALAWLRKTH